MIRNIVPPPHIHQTLKSPRPPGYHFSFFWKKRGGRDILFPFSPPALLCSSIETSSSRFGVALPNRLHGALKRNLSPSTLFPPFPFFGFFWRRGSVAKKGKGRKEEVGRRRPFAQIRQEKGQKGKTSLFQWRSGGPPWQTQKPFFRTTTAEE